MTRLAVGLLTACALAALAAPAAAESVDRATYQRLRDARGERSAALARLRAVTAVDGRPVDLRRVLAGPPARVRERAAVLRSGPGAARDAAAARRSAAAILAGADYRPRQPGLLARALSWLARLLSIPTGATAPSAWSCSAAAVAAVAALAALLLGTARRRAAARADARGRGRARSASDRPPRRNSSGARAAAEAAGRLEEAMRLQLAAALTRLDAAGAIRVRPDTTLGQVARSLRSPDFDAAADRFAGVVYGRRTPTPHDATDLRERLAATLAEAGRA